MFIYHPVQIAKIVPLEKKTLTEGQQVFVDAHPLLIKGSKYGLLDSQRMATEDMIGKWVDLAILVPSGTFELYPANDAKATEFHRYNLKRPSVLSFYGFVKGVHVEDEWHKAKKYAHLILVEACAQEILVNVDDHTFDEVKTGDMIKVNANALNILDIRNHFIRKIEENLHYIQIVKDRLDQTPPKEIPSAYGMMAHDACVIAVYYLSMDDKSNALHWFMDSYELFQKSNQSAPHVMWMLFTAILSNRPDLMKSAAEKAYSLKYEYSIDIYYLNTCLINLILGNEAEARRIAEKFEDRERTCGPKAQRYYKGLGTMCLGAVSRDVNTFRSGLNAVLQNHHNKQRGLYGFSYDTLVCFPAAVLVLLAKSRGINITPDDVDKKFQKYIPWCLSG